MPDARSTDDSAAKRKPPWLWTIHVGMPIWAWVLVLWLTIVGLVHVIVEWT